MIVATRIKQLKASISRLKAFLSDLLPEHTWNNSQLLQKEINRLKGQIQRLNNKHPGTRWKYHNIKIQSKLNYKPYTKKKKEVDGLYKQRMLAEANRRGFVHQVCFISATGVQGSYIAGSERTKKVIAVKENGDLVPKLGRGCIYDADTGAWGEIVK